MSCPFGYTGTSPQSSKDASKENDFTYEGYLQLSKLLNCIKFKSETADKPPAHDEHLFITLHQVYELWFKQILWELDSITYLFAGDNQFDGPKIFEAGNRLNRIVLILKLLIEQIHLIETILPADFMNFREYLGSASGFQSLQFRLFEIRWGIKDEDRVPYNQRHYRESFTDEMSKKELSEAVLKPSILKVIDRWLAVTPGLEKDGFDFPAKYKQAVDRWLKEKSVIEKKGKVKEEIDELLEEETDYEVQEKTFRLVLDKTMYSADLEQGNHRLSYEAYLGALMIFLYRREPRFHAAHRVLTLLQDVDSMINKWRATHVMMVQRMIGSKAGTGGSSGYLYLKSTVIDRYKVFLDLFNLATYILPERYAPALGPLMKCHPATMADAIDV